VWVFLCFFAVAVICGAVFHLVWVCCLFGLPGNAHTLGHCIAFFRYILLSLRVWVPSILFAVKNKKNKN